MINANELRIGSWVVWDNPILNIKELVQINWEDFELITNKNLGNKYNPIPLTPEILEKCGFVVEKKGSHLFYTQRDNEGFATSWLSLRGSDISSWYLLGRQHIDYFESYVQNEVKIFSLHQLQNLYFALTGQELEVIL